MKKIAFCFLIYDIINHEEIWNIFLSNINKNKYNIYIHYKTNKPLKYFESNKLNNCIETKYGDISIVKAQNLLLQEALKDNNNSHFIFISNSCIPFKLFNYIYNILNEDYSYFNIANHETCFPRCDKTLNFIDKKFIQKASQWCILNRKHATLMIKKDDYLKWFEDVPDEHCYITNIFVNNLEHEIITTTNLSNDATTFTNWNDMNYKYPSNSGLKNYSSISEEELIYLLNSKCLFGRKFNIECTILSIYDNLYINSITNSSSNIIGIIFIFAIILIIIFYCFIRLNKNILKS
jgi:hypothetical protein